MTAPRRLRLLAPEGLSLRLGAARRLRSTVAAPWGGPAAALDACAACGGGHSWGRERRPPHGVSDCPASPAAPRPRGAVAPPWGGPAAALDCRCALGRPGGCARCVRRLRRRAFMGTGTAASTWGK